MPLLHYGVGHDPAVSVVGGRLSGRTRQSDGRTRGRLPTRSARPSLRRLADGRLPLPIHPIFLPSRWLSCGRKRRCFQRSRRRRSRPPGVREGRPDAVRSGRGCLRDRRQGVVMRALILRRFGLIFESRAPPNTSGTRQPQHRNDTLGSEVCGGGRGRWSTVARRPRRHLADVEERLPSPAWTLHQVENDVPGASL